MEALQMSIPIPAMAISKIGNASNEWTKAATPGSHGPPVGTQPTPREEHIHMALSGERLVQHLDHNRGH